MQYFILEERGIIPRHSGIEEILNIANLMKRGIFKFREEEAEDEEADRADKEADVTICEKEFGTNKRASASGGLFGWSGD